jgi:prophage regulatory protein
MNDYQNLHVRTSLPSDAGVGGMPQEMGKIKILRLPEVISRVGLKRASIYQHISAGSFPKPVSLGLRAVGWLEHEIDAWLSERIQIRSRGRKQCPQ